MTVQNISAAYDPTISQGDPTAQASWTRFNQMGKALESGDLAKAQADYSALMQNAPASVQNGQGPMGQALANLGSALQSGSLSNAQQAYQTLSHHLRHHRQISEGSASPDATAEASGTSSGSNVLDVQA